MNEELEKEFYFLRNFVIEDYVNLKIDKIIACEELNTKNIVFVYLKVIGSNWQKYFLDAGAGFWEDTKITDYYKLDDNKDNRKFVFKDYTKEFNIEDKTISKIYCEPNDANCRIIIELEKNQRIILRCKKSKIFDSESEIVKM